MLNKQKRIGHPFKGWWPAVVVLACLAVQPLAAVDVKLPSLKIGTDIFTNATVYQMSDTDIFVRHERGFGNAKISSLDDETLILLGLKTLKTEETQASGALSPAAMESVKATLASVNIKVPSEKALLEAIAQFKPTPQLIAGVLAGLVICYLFWCLCLKKICVNAGSNPGFLVWIPLLQLLPMVRAARMPTWWFVVFFIPFLNILAQILWCIRIVKACGKGTLTIVMLILPITSIFAFLYLAFSNGNGSGEAEVKFESASGLAEA